MRVAAYQAPLLAAGSMDALGFIEARVRWCEAHGVSILCCPEAILGGLADYSTDPGRFAISTDAGRLDSVLAPIASETVATIVGFTEIADDGCLYNTAAVFHRGMVAGVYRKLYPAINHSLYAAGSKVPVFQVGELTLGIIICNDSNYSEPAILMAARSATALFVPTNNGLPPRRACAELVAEARNCDIARAVANNMWVIRADVAGRTDQLVSYGSSGIVDPDGMVVGTATQFTEDLVVADIGGPARTSIRA